jgi:hypothetical protein
MYFLWSNIIGSFNTFISIITNYFCKKNVFQIKKKLWTKGERNFNPECLEDML